MKTDIVLAGVGGQGILSIAATIGLAALENNLYLKQAEVHGMSQRGGAVQSHMRLSNSEILSDLIPEGSADIILSVEPMESLRYLPFLSPEGWLVTNTKPYKNINDYPDEKEIFVEIEKFGRHIALNADEIAANIGSKRSSNIVMLGAASPFFQLPFESFKEGIRRIFARKGEKIIDMNIKALEAGREFADKNM
ncbi:MAG TPA: indolepyruvate oxidoreductase subunit beta [Bacteroidales bacterium]|nr:indolepyruvate oxidoreductase subunit beta [Bacteroidales bacterium]